MKHGYKRAIAMLLAATVMTGLTAARVPLPAARVTARLPLPAKP